MLKRGQAIQECLSPLLWPFALLGLCFLSGCTPVTYPQEGVREALQEIASKEYGINNIQVEFTGTTLGVYLPLDQLFELDFKEAIMSGKVTDMESLFQPTEAAIDKVEDVLFSMSRVMLSTDKKIQFYYLQATDVEKSGMELSFLGHIEDVKRVRFWDIPRSEYRKRVIHDIRLNRAAVWHLPVRHFFRDLNTEQSGTIQARYFPKTAAEKWSREFFFVDPSGQMTTTGQARWEVADLRSIPIQDNEIVVYAKVRVGPKAPQEAPAPAKTAEYLFQISTKGDEEKIQRIIPFAYLDGNQKGLTASFTKDVVYQSLSNWESEFKTPDIQMGDFLSRQLTRRLQTATAEDERITNTFSSVKPAFHYRKEPAPSFSFDAIAPLHAPAEVPFSPEQGIHEDILYLWELAAREFVEVLRSYEFKDYQSLEFQITQGEKTLSWEAKKDALELFRRHRKKLDAILIPK